MRVHFNTGYRIFLRSCLVAKTLLIFFYSLAIFAGNACPVDVICHLPGVCEDRNIPYVYVPTGKDLGVAMGVKRCCLVVLIRRHENFAEDYDELVELVKGLPPAEPVEA